MSKKQKTAIVSVINDLVTDRRVDKTCMCLKEEGYRVILIGRKLKNSLPVQHKRYETIRMRLLFRKGVLFYLEFQLRLFLLLFFKKKDLLWSNDLDTLLPNYLCSQFFSIPLVYDSHEIFCEVPELKNSPLKKKTWEFLEKKLITKNKFRITVNESIAKWFLSKYHTTFSVIRNISDPPEFSVSKSRNELNLPSEKKIIILQGAGINIDRGAEELVEAMHYVGDFLLLIIGSGDVIERLKLKSIKLELQDKIRFIPKLSPEELFAFTACADLGISIDKNTNINYQFSLPNKLFDYLHAGIPVLASRLCEIEKVILKYQVGNFIENHQPEHIAQKIVESLSHPDYENWKMNTKKIKEELNWTNEKKVLIDLIREI